MGTRKRQAASQNGRPVGRQSRKRKSRRKRKAAEFDSGGELSGSDFDFSDTECSPPVATEKAEHVSRRAAAAAEVKPGVSPVLWASLLILLIAVTGGVYMYNFGDMSQALDTLHTRLSTIITPHHSQQVPESPPSTGSASEAPSDPTIVTPAPATTAKSVTPTPPADKPLPPDKPAETKKKPYSKAGITNAYDKKIQSKLDEADAKLDKGVLNKALKAYDELLKLHPQSARARYGRAHTLDQLSNQQQSNTLLEQCIEEYSKVLALTDVPKDLFLLAGKRCADRQTFRGLSGRAVKTLSLLVRKYPADVALRNSLGIGYLHAGRNDDAFVHFGETLKIAPNDGVALVHYGFILKWQHKKNLEAIEYLQRGIDTGDEGTMDGRFIFHLGDAYYRTGQHNKSYEVYKVGAKNGLFKSYWQRSLYNVDRLQSQPYWTLEDTKIDKQLRNLRKHWKTIRDEGVAQLTSRGTFQDEAESLLNTGDWKQLTMFSQGRKDKKVCALVPKTCALIEQIPEAAGCRRGQVKYSVMHPGTRVWPHCGPTNCRIRAHLGLVVPEGPRIRVGEEIKMWKEGEYTIFDDSFEHEVWHDGDSLRLVLIIDLWHPDLTQHERNTLSAI